MKQTSNIERSEPDWHQTPNAELRNTPLAFDVRRSAFGVRRLLQLILGFLLAAVFIYAGIIKILDPVGFARDIDNYKILPWPAAVASGFFLPWLEVFCGLALIIRRCYRGALLILCSLTIVFVIASVVAKARGLDISCGCFGHASKGWSFGWHLALDFGLLAALVVLWLPSRVNVMRHESPSHRDGLQL